MSSKNTLRTLKDISLKGAKRRNVVGRRLVDYDEAKNLAIKCVKEDIKEFNLDLNYERKGVEILNRKWMKRLNIEESDLQ